MVTVCVCVYYLQLSFNSELLKKFWFLKRILSPVLETYYVVACRLTLLEQGEMPGMVIGEVSHLIFMV